MNKEKKNKLVIQVTLSKTVVCDGCAALSLLYQTKIIIILIQQQQQQQQNCFFIKK